MKYVGKGWGRLGVRSPALLSGEALVEKVEHLGDVELDVFQIQILLVVFLHFEKIIQFEVELEKASVAT